MADNDDCDCVNLESFFYDEATTMAEAVVAAKRLERKKQERAREKEAVAKRWAAHKAVMESIREYDPVEKRYIYFHYHYEGDMSDFDLDEKFGLAPMHFTDTIYTPPARALRFLCDMINVLAIRVIVPSYPNFDFGCDDDEEEDDDDDDDVCFPMSVYGSVIARDHLDLKCVPLFRRSRQDAQLIASEDESLTLTGPHRGLVLYDGVYFEFDLKMNDDRQCHKDKKLSKGLLVLDGVQLAPKLSNMQTAVQSLTLPSSSIRLCTVHIAYAFVSHAVEATISVEHLNQGGHLCGEITACTSTIQDSIVLHDSIFPAAGVMAADGNGHFIPLLRRVMAVSLDEMLVVTIVAQADDGVNYSRRTIDFTPAVNGREEAQIVCGVTSLLLKVNWSLMRPVIDQK